MSSLHLAVLGPICVQSRTETRSLFASLPAMVIGLLVCCAAAGRPITRSRLAGSLWPDQTEARARRNLADALYRLRRALGDELAGELLCVDEETVGLGDVRVDADDFRRLAASSSLDEWRAALELYRGDLLEELDAEWLLAPRAELRERYLATLERVCTALTEAGHFANALSVAHRWALADPLAENAHLAAMRLYARLGRYAAALQQYDQLARLLDQELGLPPMRETRALADAIRAEASIVPHRPDLPFVGRRAERAQLLRLAEEAQAGRGGLVLVEGEPGMGKTRLLKALADGAQWRGLQVVWGTPRELGATKLYAPLDEAFADACAGPRIEQVRPHLSPASVEVLASLVPRLRAGPTPPLPTPPEWSDALAEGISALADLAPQVLICDDVQWAGAGFWSVLARIAPTLDTRRLLVVLSYRDAELRANPPAWLALRALDTEFAPSRLTLAGLPPHECAEMARLLGHPAASDIVTQLYTRTRGNPLFVRELLLQPAAGAESFAALLERRLSALTPEARAALEAGAVLGREFAHGPWQALVGERLLATLPHLLAGRFLEETEHGYAFQHDLTREYVYGSIPPERRRDVHRRAGDVLAREHAEPDTLAWHFEQGEAWPEAVRYSREAGDRAASVFAYDAALAHYQRAQKFLNHLNEPEAERMALLAGQQRVYRATVREREWRATVDQLEQAALAAEDRVVLLEALQARISLHLLSADWKAMQSAAERAIALAQEEGNLAAEARTRLELGWHLADMLGQAGEALPHLQRAALLAEQLADTPLLLEVLGHLAFAQRIVGQTLAARETALRALAVAAARRELLRGRAGALEILGQVEIDLASWRAARETMREFVELCAELKARWLWGQGLFNQAFIAARIGLRTEARERIEALKSLLTDAGLGPPSDHWMWTEALNADALVLAGELEQAELVLGAMRAWMASKSGGRPLLLALTALGRLRLAQHRPAEARDALARALGVWEQSGGTIEVAPLLLHALAAHRTGDDEAARAILQRVESILCGTEVATHNVLLHFVRYELSGQAADLHAARAEIQRQAALFADETLRADFLTNVSLHREIEAHWQALYPPPATVCTALTRADAPLGKALTAADRVIVTWTIDAGEADAEILCREGKVALRRHRLCRLIAQARAQGAAPTDADLAAALGVNLRTIERDVAALRAAGRPAPTRKRKA